MAITYPLDLLADFPGWSVEFDLLWRQEQSRQANGRTIVKDMGSPLWRATYQTRSLKPNELDKWRARLAAMENGLKTFKGYPLSRCRPIAHPGSSVLPAGAIASIGADRKTVTLSGFVGITLQAGDMICIRDKDLHQIVDVAGGVYEVRPHIWPGVDAGDSPAPTVTISKPHCIMAIVPGSITSTADMSTGRGAVSFQAIEAR